MENNLIEVIPVIPSADIERDVNWYNDKMGFTCRQQDEMYAVLKRGEVYLHLQWHADTEDDPLLGGSVIKIFVKDIHKIFKEFCIREVVKPEKLRMRTPWNTHEFGFYDLNRNAIFMVQDI